MILGFYRKTIPEQAKIDKIPAKCKDIPKLPSLNKITFVFCAVKMQMYPRFVSVAHRHKYLKDVQILRSQGYEIFNQDAETLN